MPKSFPVISGHAPSHIRGEFAELAEDRSTWSSPEMHRLTGKLWNCTDVMASELRRELDVFDDRGEPVTYAQGARTLRRYIRDLPSLP